MTNGQLLTGRARRCSQLTGVPVKEKKPSEHSSPAKKELNGNVPTSIM